MSNNGNSPKEEIEQKILRGEPMRLESHDPNGNERDFNNLKAFIRQFGRGSVSTNVVVERTGRGCTFVINIGQLPASERPLLADEIRKSSLVFKIA